MPVKRKTLPPPVVRREPPTIEEAVAAAQGLASDPQAQLEIAAGLMGVPEDQVRPYLARPMAIQAPQPLRSGRRVVVVERRIVRGGGAAALRR